MARVVASKPNAVATWPAVGSSLTTPVTDCNAASANLKQDVEVPLSWKAGPTQALTEQGARECSPRGSYLYVYVHHCKDAGRAGPMLVVARVKITKAYLESLTDSSDFMGPCFKSNYWWTQGLSMAGLLMLIIGVLVFMVLPGTAKAIYWVWAKCCG